MKDFAIRSDKTKEFIEEFNNNVITEEFLKECNQAYKLFNKELSNNMKQIIIVRKDLIDQYGYPKMMVQVAHASTKIFTDKIWIDDIVVFGVCLGDEYKINISKEQYNWAQGNYKKIILYVKSEEKLLKIYEDIKEKYPSVLIKDHALTIYPHPMNTCVGVMGSDEDMECLSKKYKLQLIK